MLESLTGRFDLLSRERDFRRLLAARAVSEVGSWVAYVALSVEMYRRTGSALWIAALLLAEFVPQIVVGLALGPLVDRLPRRVLLVGCDLVNAAVFAAVVFAPSPLALVGLALVAGCALALFRPAVQAGLPNLVSDSDLPNAASLLQTVETLAVMAGPATAGAVVAAFGPDPLYLANAGSFAVSALLLSRLPARRLDAGERAGEPHWRAVRAGFGAFRNAPLLVTFLVAGAAANVAVGGTNATELVLAEDALRGGDLGYGILAGACGLGLALGCFLAGPLLERAAPERLWVGALAVFGLGLAGVAASPTLPVALVFVLVSTVANGVGLVTRVVTIQRTVPDAIRGRVVATMSSAAGVGVLVGMTGLGALADAAGPRASWAVAAGLVVLAGSVGAARLRAPRAAAAATASVRAAA